MSRSGLYSIHATRISRWLRLRDRRLRFSSSPSPTPRRLPILGRPRFPRQPSSPVRRCSLWPMREGRTGRRCGLPCCSFCSPSPPCAHGPRQAKHEEGNGKRRGACVVEDKPEQGEDEARSESESIWAPELNSRGDDRGPTEEVLDEH